MKQKHGFLMNVIAQGKWYQVETKDEATRAAWLGC